MTVNSVSEYICQEFKNTKKIQKHLKKQEVENWNINRTDTCVLVY